MAAQPQRAATADGGKGNVDAEARTKQERWSPLSACSRGFYRAGYKAGAIVLHSRLRQTSNTFDVNAAVGA